MFTAPATQLAASDRHSRLLQDLDPLETRFGPGHRLPLPLRRDLALADLYSLDWAAFSAAFAPAPSLRLSLTGHERLRGGTFRFAAEFTTPTAPNHSSRRDVIATGPVSACTQLFAAAGRPLEIATFRQVELHEATATFLLSHHPHHHDRQMWAFGFGATAQASVAAAMSSATQRIHG